MKIEVIPINAMGKKAWFRKSSADFDIVEGMDLIEITEYNKESGFITIRSKGKAGLVELKLNPSIPYYRNILRLKYYH
ncbi:MAG: hypothetical protein IPJ23_03850 [Ignavibacteriales bacterium]|nr:hypothetical protein [Ignavibacteriales bacterium]